MPYQPVLSSEILPPSKYERGKGIELLYDAALLEDAQLKKTLRKSKQETHKLQASGSSEGVDVESEVPDEQIGKTKDTSKGTSVKLKGEYENDDLNDEDDDDSNDDDSGSNDDGDNDAQDNEQIDSDNDESPSFTLKDYEEEEQDEEYVFSLEKEKSNDEEKMFEEYDDDVAKELYRDLNITQGLRDTDMTNAEQGTVQSSSISSDFTSKLLNLDNTGPDVNEIASLMNIIIVPPSPPPVNPSSHLTTTPQQQTPDFTTTTTNPTITLLEIPNFSSLFGFEQRVSALETKMFEFNQTTQLAEVVSSIQGIVDQYLDSKMKEAVDVAVRL
ncbi:hypothetical protein Tco_1280277 [Tanacetum coccineum]